MKGYALAAVLVCVFLSTKASDYHRTVRYVDQIVMKCELTESFNVRLEGLLNEDFVDPWGLDKEGRLHVRLGRQLWTELQSTLPECSLVIDNLEEYVMEAEKVMFNNKSRLGADWFEAYHTYDDIVDWYNKLAEEHSTIAKFDPSIGKSYEGRDMPAVHITGTSENEKLTVYFQCQIHAREWISGAVCMFIANYLCENYEKDADVTKLMDGLEFVFVPFVNPDGYEYTWTDDRLWRKNRGENPGSSCIGVDLNRNYNDHWNEGGSSSNPCTETYHGSAAASELETQTTQNYFMEQNRIVAAIDWHSFSQLILRPYGWTRNDCPDEEQLKQVGDTMSSRAYEIHGVRYTSQKSIDLYPTSGTASDWFYGEQATSENDGFRAAGYTIELRDTGQYGFLLPPDQIIPCGEEMVPAALYLAEAMLNNPINT